MIPTFTTSAAHSSPDGTGTSSTGISGIPSSGPSETPPSGVSETPQSGASETPPSGVSEIPPSGVSGTSPPGIGASSAAPSTPHADQHIHDLPVLAEPAVPSGPEAAADSGLPEMDLEFPDVYDYNPDNDAIDSLEYLYEYDDNYDYFTDYEYNYDYEDYANKKFPWIRRKDNSIKIHRY